MSNGRPETPTLEHKSRSNKHRRIKSRRDILVKHKFHWPSQVKPRLETIEEAERNEDVDIKINRNLMIFGCKIGAMWDKNRLARYHHSDKAKSKQRIHTTNGSQ